VIQQQGNGRYKVTVERPDAAGKRVRVCRTVDTHEQAQQVEQQLASRPADADGRTVIDALDRYVALHRGGWAPNTERAYVGGVERYVRPYWLASVRLDALDPERLERYYGQLQAGTVAPHAPTLSLRTVRGVARLVRQALADVERARWIRREQYDGARVIPAALDDDHDHEPRRAVDDYDLGDIARVLEGLDEGDDLGEVVHLAIATGARRGELAALRWRDIDLVGGVVRIDGNVCKGRPGDNAWQRRTTKTRKVRRVRLDPSCAAMLTSRYLRQVEAAERAGVDDLDDRAVLSRRLERDYTSPQALGQRWVRAARAAGVRLRFHDLRHVNTSEQVAAGVPVLNVAARNGWSTPAMLLEVYGHARAEVDDLATTALANAWRRIEAHRAS
jgi:integrase